MTNRHVVPEGTTSVSVTLSDGTVYEDVKVIGRTNDHDSLDVAFLKIRDTGGKALTAARIGNFFRAAIDRLEVGAIANRHLHVWEKRASNRCADLRRVAHPEVKRVGPSRSKGRTRDELRKGGGAAHDRTEGYEATAWGDLSRG